ncbi:TRAP transporter permease [Endozoicomonas sp. SM1973]|uniref:TRAP transporter permease n=1 Tax=Spartinivicinus marinus TaxID=2994442 RepID=A0A853I3I6_9GAMM|nr:TRAP transporter permease [Spartinivicinus marinus]MCX4028512.1 TRAP transporter permease [Spartinivicinus marinus]NYZ67179.1 TRAP transporter permease [Spartinivicinus marinus]
MTSKDQDLPLDQNLEQMIAEADSGARAPRGIPAYVLLLVPICWSLFQLWIASPLPSGINTFIYNNITQDFSFGLFNSTESRAIHLGFALFLAFTAYPAFKRSPRYYIPIQDWFFALVGVACTLYLVVFKDDLANRAGAPTTADLVTAGIGMLLLLEATRRALGPPLMIVAGVFLVYTFAGPYMPDVIAYKGASLQKALSHFWITSEGVFGVALGVATDFVFLFVLFGALLDRAGAGSYFIQVAFSLLGHLKGGPAKAAVVSSGLSGIVSGSSIANVVTTGTFTIPLMKRVGFPASKAGAIEVAASTNGQLTPPVMGAAAFLMVEYVGIDYIEVIKHAILPALISYIALFYIVHLEALKSGMEGLPRPYKPTLVQSLLTFIGTILGLCALSLIVYYGIGWSKSLLGDAAIWVIGAITFIAYVALVAYSTKYPAPHLENPDQDVIEMPPVGPTVKSGLYFLLPIVILVWCLTVERLSASLSAFWATVFMIFIVVTHRPLKVFFAHKREASAATTTATVSDYAKELREKTKLGFSDLMLGFATGARNMIGIGVATAAAGIIVGVVTLTGIGQKLTEVIGLLSQGSILLVLIFTAIISLILGMGLPTTANYIVVSSLMAPVIVSLGAENGLIVPLIAVHLFVFYFGILADDTPPVGLAAYAAAAIAQSDPIKTGIQGFIYDIRTAILPFMFIFNTQLLLIDIGGPLDLTLVILSALGAMLVFSAATQGFWFVKNRWYETVGLLLVAFTLFRPGFWWDYLYEPTNFIPAKEIYQMAEQVGEGKDLRLRVGGETIDGQHKEKTVLLRLPKGDSGEAMIRAGGLELLIDDVKGTVTVDSVDLSSAIGRQGVDFDWQIIRIEQENTDRPNKQWMFIPALLLLGGIFLMQRRRKQNQSTTA